MPDAGLWRNNLADQLAKERARYEAAVIEVADARPPEFSDEALALRFAEKHCDEARYVAALGKWLFWDGTKWSFDTTLDAFNRARMVCRVASAEADGKSAISLASAKTVAAVVNLARADRRIAATIEQWDANPWLLNTPEGIIDLHTGYMMSGDPLRYITKMTACRVSDSGCPLWLQFLNRVTAGDHNLQSFLQRVIGYALTGSIREHALFFLYGTGANGKGVFINTVNAVLADNAAVAPMETFIARQTERHPTDLAGLRGARLVTAQETEQGRHWDEAKIKALTGGDPISARFMRQDFFTFQPAFKLVIAGNHKPGLRGVDEATKRRFNLIPFTVTIPVSERDLELSEKLRVEWPGILRWAIEGCLEWQRTGLNPPAVVRDATDAYLASEDSIANWIEERCTVVPNEQDRATALFESWTQWAQAAGEHVGMQKRFTQTLQDRGFVSFKHSRTRQAMFRGISVRPCGAA